MIPNCEGCAIEFEEGIRYIKQDYDVCFEGLGERKHLLIAVFDKAGEIVLS